MPHNILGSCRMIIIFTFELVQIQEQELREAELTHELAVSHFAHDNLRFRNNLLLSSGERLEYRQCCLARMHLGYNSYYASRNGSFLLSCQKATLTKSLLNRLFHL